MRAIVDSNEAFDLYSQNCSETALQILSAGENTSPSVFDKRGLFFKVANPFLVVELCQKYQEKLNENIIQEPESKKIKIESPRIESLDEDDSYIEIKETCPFDALSQCHSALNKSNHIVPYLPPKTISELHILLSDNQAHFGCQIHDENGETQLIDPKVLLNQVRAASFERAKFLRNQSNSNINNINLNIKNTPSDNPKKRKREMVDGLL